MTTDLPRPCEPETPDPERELLARIPPGLQAKLLELKGTLIEQGCVQTRVDRRRQPFHRLRYRIQQAGTDHVHHHSLALGACPVLAQVVRDLLGLWRRAGQAGTTSPDGARPGSIVAEEFGDSARLLREAVKSGMPRSRRRKRLLDQFDRMVEEGTPADLLLFSLNAEQLMSQRRPAGRPPKLRCW